MITQRYFERDANKILFRIAVNETFVLDILTSDSHLARCRQLLQAPSHLPAETIRMGTFGAFEVSLTVWRDEATILINAPALGDPFRGDQTAGVYLQREDLLTALDESREFRSKMRSS